MSKKNKTPFLLEMNELQAKGHLELLNRLFAMGSYDYIFPKQIDEKRADEVRKALKDYLEK